MKIEKLETHDRYQHFLQDQEANIFAGAEECIKRNPDSLEIQDFLPYVYIFAHPRTAEDGVTKRMLWQARMSKPKPQTNSYCFRVISHTDNVEVCWLLPPKAMWPQYTEGKIAHSDIVNWSINMFTKKYEDLEKPHKDDWSEEQIKSKLDGLRQALVAAAPRPDLK